MKMQVSRSLPSDQGSATELLNYFVSVRAKTLDLCSSLEVEDFGVQPMADASPPKWHLAHTTWFFEAFLLKVFKENFQPFHESFGYLFNSYYIRVGQPFPRSDRGNLSRPTVREIMDYRSETDRKVIDLITDLGRVDQETRQEILSVLRVGTEHEQQHQELLITDLKYNFGNNPLYPAYRADKVENLIEDPLEQDYEFHEGGLFELGAGDDGFAFDNERPKHRTYIEPFLISNKTVTNREFLQFIEDDGYKRHEFWLSEGWALLQQKRLETHPLYWRNIEGVWFEYRLDGLFPLALELPVTHISAYEAMAFANWSQARLPTEAEWELASAKRVIAGNFLEKGLFHPKQPSLGEANFFGNSWEWTSSAYSQYPGFRPLDGALGEYNGKFMSSQLVLRGGSCLTPERHIRRTYRNFFYPPDQWQFTGLRLAKDI